MPRGANNYQSAQIQGRLWTPAVLRPALWLDGADLSTITISTGISEWRDKSGNERHATQATTGKQPSYTALSELGTPRIKYSGGQVLNVGGSAFSMTLLFTVCQTNTSPTFTNYPSVMCSLGSPGIFPLFGGNASSDIGCQMPAQSSTTSRPVINGGPIPASTTNSFVPMSQLKIVSSIGYSASASRSNWTIGVGDINLYYWNGDIDEIIVPNGNLADSERSLVEGYLSWKWGITLAADHPFANRPPLIGD